jgi:hypothetical protein
MRTRFLLATLLCAAFSGAALAQTPGTPGTFKEDIQRPTSNGATADRVGDVTVNIKNGTAGDSHINLTSAGITPGLPPHTTYSVNFCILASNPVQCHAVTTITTDASGNASKSFTFPRLGNYVGVFFFSRSSHPNELVSAVQQDSGDSFYNAHLQRVKSLNYSSTNKSIGPQGNDPLKDGTVVHHDFMFFRVTLAGAKPSTTYSVRWCEFGFSGSPSTGCSFLGQFNTDQNGNGSTDVQFSSSSNRHATFQAGAFLIRHLNTQGGATEFLSGFVVKR